MPLIHDKRVSETSPVSSALRSFFSHFDPLQLIPMLVLLAFGIIFVYGTGQQVGGVHAEVFWKRQIIWVSIGLCLWLFFSFFNYKYLGPASILLYAVALVLLALVLVKGIGVLRFGARRWLDIAGVSVQPAEIAKLAVILLVSWLLSLKRFPVNNWKTLLLLVGLLAPCAVLILKQPNLSMTLTLCMCAFAIVFCAGFKWKYLLIGLIVISICAPVGYYGLLRPYHRDRIRVFLNPDLDPLNKGWNQRQSEMAVGSGRLTGKGFMQGTQSMLGYLPQTVSNSDFIFPVIAEETGFLGASFLLLMYVLLMISIFRTALNAPDEFGRYLCVGVGTVFAMHSIVNIGMSIRLMPVTGQPLPLVSYGGTFMLASLSYLGIVQSVYVRRNRNSEE